MTTTTTTNSTSLGAQDLNELFIFFQGSEREFQAAAIIYSFAFGASVLAIAGVFTILLQPETIRRFRGTKRSLVHFIHVLAMAVLTLVYFVPEVINQSQYSDLPDLKADLLLDDLRQAYVPFWAPSANSQIIFSITLWLTDCVLFYCLFVIWRRNWIVLILFGMALLAVIVVDFLMLPIAVLLAFAYESLAFCFILARFVQSRKNKGDPTQILPPPLAVVLCSGVFCALRAVWVASFWGAGGHDIWGNPAAFAASIVIQCFGVASFAMRQPVRSDDSSSTVPLGSQLGSLV